MDNDVWQATIETVKVLLICTLLAAVVAGIIIGGFWI
jgi:ABC-type phosphate/phosphonate transport system permease subunit